MVQNTFKLHSTTSQALSFHNKELKEVSVFSHYLVSFTVTLFSCIELRL